MTASSAVMAVPLISASRWRHASFALLLAVTWVLVWYRDSVTSMVSIWYRSDTFAHGFLVPPIVAWLIWRQRHAIARVVPQPSPGVLPAMALVGLLWLMGELAAANTLTQSAMVAMLVLSVPLVLGWSATRCIVFPLGFLLFAVPMGEFLLPQLMEWTANFTVFALRLSGVPVYREGLNFVIPSGRWSVVEACSGVRYLIASLTVGSLFAYLNYRSFRRRAIFVVASIVVPVVANWVRAYMIVMLAHLSNNRIATGVDHLLYGWLFFGVVIVLMFLVGVKWAQPENVAGEGGLEPAAAAPEVPPSASVTPIWLAAMALVTLSAMPHLALWAMDRNEMIREGAGTQVLAAPAVLGSGWDLANADAAADMSQFKPAYQNPSQILHAEYGRSAAVVGLYLAVYRQQGRGHALVSSDNVLVPSKDQRWSVVARSSRRVVAGNQAMTVRISELKRADLIDSIDRGALLVWQVNWVNGMVTHDDYLAKAYGAFFRLFGHSDDAAAIVIYTPAGRAGSGDAVLESFWSDNFAAIEALLMRNGRAHTVNGREVSS